MLHNVHICSYITQQCTLSVKVIRAMANQWPSSTVIWAFWAQTCITDRGWLRTVQDMVVAVEELLSRAKIYSV